MEGELKCNRLTCRKSLIDKAVVTTCSHIFCVDCANELFNASRLCPACETTLMEPDDVVICCLHPTNDYKTSILSGLSPTTILDICNRAIAFWQYQIHQENAFQYALVRNINDKNAQLQKQLDNVIREANNEMTLLKNKIAELERDLEIERRKVRDLQETTREKDKEYQKLKVTHEKMRRKALLAPTLGPANETIALNSAPLGSQRSKPYGGGSVDIGTMVENMESNGIQRTPLGSRSLNEPAFNPSMRSDLSHTHSHSSRTSRHPMRPMMPRQRQSASMNAPRHNGNMSDHSEDAYEVENMLFASNYQIPRASTASAGWQSHAPPSVRRPYPPLAMPPKRASGMFKPAVAPR